MEGTDYNWCQATMPLEERGVNCVYDCDCAPGMSCVALRTDEAPTCQIKCRGNVDCPRSSFCDVPGDPTGANKLVCQ